MILAKFDELREALEKEIESISLEHKKLELENLKARDIQMECDAELKRVNTREEDLKIKEKLVEQRENRVNHQETSLQIEREDLSIQSQKLSIREKRIEKKEQALELEGAL